MKHKFEDVAILCTTDEQIQHLATMVIVDGITKIWQYKKRWNYFREDGEIKGQYSNFFDTGGKPVVTYADFIAGMQDPDTQVVEVTGCSRCPFSEGFGNAEWCNHPEHDNESDSLFSTCPLKKGAVTIKLKQ